MNELKYTITDFDETAKVINVTFDDNSWAQIRLTNPLPKNKEELENIIKDFAPPVEAIQAQINPDADLNYIKDLVDKQNITARKLLNPPIVEQVDEETARNAEMWEQVQFKKEVADILVELGLLKENPVVLPITEV